MLETLNWYGQVVDLHVEAQDGLEQNLLIQIMQHTISSTSY